MAKWLTDPGTGERVRFVSRKECGLPASRAPEGAWEREHAIAHHGVGRGNGVPLRECMAIWRGYHRYHTQDKGWTDIGYSSGWGDAPDVGGAVLEGRWWGNDGAHTQNGGNRLGYAGCYIGDGREAVADSAWRAWRAWLAEGSRVGAFPSDPELSDHNDWFRKVCAGPKIRSVLHAKSKFTRTPEPEPDDPEDDDMPKEEVWTGTDPEGNEGVFLVRRALTIIDPGPPPKAAPGVYQMLTPEEADEYKTLGRDRGLYEVSEVTASPKWFKRGGLVRVKRVS